MENPTERIEHRLNKLKSIKSVYELIYDTYKYIGNDKTEQTNDWVQLFSNNLYDFYNKHQKLRREKNL